MWFIRKKCACYALRTYRNSNFRNNPLCKRLSETRYNGKYRGKEHRPEFIHILKIFNFECLLLDEKLIKSLIMFSNVNSFLSRAYTLASIDSCLSNTIQMFSELG